MTEAEAMAADKGRGSRTMKSGMGFLVILHPSQVWMAENLGWIEGKHYVVSRSLSLTPKREEQ